MRLIDADDLMDNAYEIWLHGTPVIIKALVNTLANMIDSAPTIEAEPVKHGRWEEYPSPLFLRCSVCKCEYEKSRMPLKHVGWCPNPNCGAKMDLKVEHE